MSISLYRRYRPGVFAEMAGQGAAVDLVQNSIISGSVAHAYLFSGPRGSGKTSLARLLAKAVNCLELSPEGEPCGKCRCCLSITKGDSLDVVEIDGASNNGVDEVRELKTHVNLSPFSSKFKIYIIDEVHMLSISAFNALLKTLEEPPEKVVFILATTEPHKVPVTIRSRCQHIPFHRISEKVIMDHLPVICDKEQRRIEKEAVVEIARQADGALRDALSILEQAMAVEKGTITLSTISSVLSGGSYSDLEKFLKISREDEIKAVSVMQDILMKGASPSRVLEYLYLLSRNLWFEKRWGPEVLESLDISKEEIEFITSEADHWSADKLFDLMKFCMETIPLTRTGFRTDVLAGLIITNVLAAKENVYTKQQETKVNNETSGSAEDQQKKNRSTMENLEIQGKDPKIAMHDNNNMNIRIKSDDKQPDLKAHKTDKQSLSSAPGNGKETLDPDWKEFPDGLSKEMINLYASLLHAAISIEDNEITIDFGKNFISSFAIMSSPGNAYSLQQYIEENYQIDVSLKIICSDKEVLFPSEATLSSHEEIESGSDMGSQASLFQPGKRKNSSKTDEITQDKSEETVNVPDVEQSGSLFTRTVSDVVQITSGELLYVQDQDSTDPDEKPNDENEA